MKLINNRLSLTKCTFNECRYGFTYFLQYNNLQHYTYNNIRSGFYKNLYLLFPYRYRNKAKEYYL